MFQFDFVGIESLLFFTLACLVAVYGSLVVFFLPLELFSYWAESAYDEDEIELFEENTEINESLFAYMQ